VLDESISKAKRTYFVLLILFGCGIGLYWTIFRGYFISDDFLHVKTLYAASKDINIILQNFYRNWLNVPVTSFYRPFISVTLYIDSLIWGFNPIGYHFTNLLFHMLNAYFIFIISRKLFANNVFISLISSFLFLSFPTHPEAVYWIIGRVDTQATFFYLATFVCYILYRENQKRFFLLLSIIAFMIGLGSKETVVTIPIILFLYELIIIRKDVIVSSFVHSIKRTWIFYVVLVIYFIARKIILGTFAGGYNDQSVNISFVTELITKWQYPLKKLLFPWNEDYFTAVLHQQTIGYIYITFWVLFLLIAFLTKFKSFISREFLFLFCSFIISLIPITPVIFVGSDLQGARNLYLPSVFFILGLVYTISFISNKTNFARFRVGIMTGTLIFLAIVQSYTLLKNLEPWDAVSQRLKVLPATFNNILVERENNPKYTVVVNMTDNYYGAYFLRNGYDSFLSPPILKKRFNNISFYGEKSIEGFGSTLKDYLIKNSSASTYDLFKYNFSTNKLEKFPVKLNSTKSQLKDIDFSQKDFVFWNKSKDLKMEQKGNESFFNVIGSDPFLFTNKVVIEPDDTNYMSLTMKVLSNKKSDIGQFYWTSSNEPFSETKKIEFPIISDNQYHTYKINLGSEKKWLTGGKITSIRIDPLSESSTGEVFIKSAHIERTSLNKEGVPIWNDVSSSWQSNSLDGKLDKEGYYIKGINISFLSPIVNINPWKTNFISITMSVSSSNSLGKVYWTTENNNAFDESKKVEFPIIPDGKMHTYNVPLKNEIPWWSSGSVTQLRLDPAEGDSKVSVNRVELLSGEDLVPKLTFANEKSNKMKESFYRMGYVLNFEKLNENQLNFNVNFDAQNISSAKGIALEISKLPYENPNGYSLSSRSIALIKEPLLVSNQYQLNIKPFVSTKGLYFIRIIGLKGDGSITGNFSDPLVVLYE
jgi:protein O-mannosyl-transferase